MANVSGKIVGDKLILEIDIGKTARGNCTVSKSAIAKAIKEGRKVEDLPKNLIASSEGFISFGEGVKVSLNATVS